MTDTRPRVIQIPDPIHGYIPVEARFMDIVDTPEFQRLRSIEQGSFRPAFPGARHDRFIHSLGTYHLATRFVEHFFRNLKEDTGVRLDPAEESKLRLTFRYAALLHDVGHAPFSHTTEDLFLEAEEPVPDDPNKKMPSIWLQLCDAVEKLDHITDQSFRLAVSEKQGAAHEIMSALILLRNHDQFTGGSAWKDAGVDPELAVRMIIGYPYPTTGIWAPTAKPEIQATGVRNCLIRLLNCSVLDVDRLDYLVRDTKMSGFFNAPLDLNALACSVTAVEENGWLQPAFRSSAISAIETMYNAKLSHDAWVLAHPAGAYDAALRQHCIRQLDPPDCEPEDSYIRNVFCADALGSKGITFRGKTYRLLSDTDVAADLKAHSGAPFDELLTRTLDRRRRAAWSSYYEFRYLFTVPGTILTHTEVNAFFRPLIKYMEKAHLFEFNDAAFQKIMDSTSDDTHKEVREAASFLDTYLRKLQAEKKKDESAYSVVLLARELNFTMKLDPKLIRIVFTKKTFPKRRNVTNWTTFEKLRNLTGEPWTKENDYLHDGYFYLFRRGGLGCKQLETLRSDLLKVLTAKKVRRKTRK